MIVITGTKRSGTSMWMQILQAGGIKVVGSAFTKTWKETIEAANKRGFYESRFRRGIYYATNPNPKTGRWLSPRASRNFGVKIFVPGVIRSDVVYLSRVVGSVRPWQQYVSSLNRLYQMEKEGHEAKGSGEFLSPHLDPVLEWWIENFLLVRDFTTRRYPSRLVSYEAMLNDPEKLCTALFEWFGEGDAKEAMRAIHPEDRTQHAKSEEAPKHRFAEVFEDYHDRILNEKSFDEAFLNKMNETHLALLPEIDAALTELGKKVSQVKARREEAYEAGTLDKKDNSASTELNPDRLDALLHPEGERE